VISIRQIKAARALLGWSQEDLARTSGISYPTIARLESNDGEIGGRAGTAAKIVSALREAGIEFTNGGYPGVRMKNDLIKLQFRNAQLRGKITTALKKADDPLQRADERRAKLLAKTSDETVDTLADVFENLRGRALALVKAGVAKREDFPEIG
jgi:transcriptional regulator with XRE-family HTH domain